MKVGAVYMVRGGHILRYQGLYSNKGPALAFGDVREEGPFDPPCGYSTTAGDVLYEITAGNLPMLKFSREERRVRNLPTEDLDYLIAKLGTP